MYTTDENLAHPYVSPFYGDFDNLPPILIQSGSVERLDDEIVATSFKASSAISSDVTFERYLEHVHVFPCFFKISEGAEVAVQRAAKWIRANTINSTEW
jgi:acetyl esterase/lipase